MATIVGRHAKVAISSDGISYTDIGKVTSASMSLDTDILDETNNDSGGYKESQYGDSQASLDVSFKFNSGDGGQADLFDSYDQKLPRYFRFRPEESAGEIEYSFQGRVSSISMDTETGAVEDGSFTVESTGTITKATQP